MYLQTLLERGANASADDLGSSPLIYAVLAGKSATAKYLAEKVCFKNEKSDFVCFNKTKMTGPWSC